MRKKTKRFLGAVLGGILVLQTMFGAVVAFAANTSDTSWGLGEEDVFYYNINNGYTFETDVRDKTNATSVYVFYKNGNISTIRVTPYKTHYGNKSDGVTGIYKSSRNNYMDYYAYTVGLERTMYNNIYETGYNYAYLKVNTAGQGGWAWGLWSPDSTKEYN